MPAGELAAFVLRDQRDYWRREVDRAANWPQDIWVDLGLLTFARSTVTLRGSRGDHEADGSLKQGACAACGDGPYWTYPISPCARLFPAPCGARPSAGSGLESSG